MVPNNIKELTTKVEKVLEQLRPYLQTDGGNVELLEITNDMIVRVRFLGSCSTCNMSQMTLKAGIEECILKAVPEIIAVEAISPVLENI